MINDSEHMWTFNRVGLLSQGFTQDGGFVPLGTIADFPDDFIPPPGWMATDGSWVNSNYYRKYSERLSPVNKLSTIMACALFDEDGTTPFAANPVSHGHFLTDGNTKIFLHVDAHTLRLVSIPEVEAAATAGLGPVILATSHPVSDRPLVVIVVQTVEGGAGEKQYRFFSTTSTDFPVTWTEHIHLNMPVPPNGSQGTASTQGGYIYFVSSTMDVWQWDFQTPDQPPVKTNPIDCNWDARKAEYSPRFIPGTPYLHRLNFGPWDQTITPSGYGHEIQQVGDQSRFFTLGGGRWNDEEDGEEVNAFTDLIEGNDNYPMAVWLNRYINPWTIGFQKATFSNFGTPITEYPDGIKTVKGHNYQVSFDPSPSNPSPLLQMRGITGIKNSFRYPNGNVPHISVLEAEVATGVDQRGDVWTPSNVVMTTWDFLTWFPVHSALFEGPGITPMAPYTGGDPTGTIWGSQQYILTNTGALIHLGFIDLNQFKLPTSTAPAGFRRYICVQTGKFASPGGGNSVPSE